jgi:acetyltransferase-like isoleucine patch superfamily enzyme
MSLNGIIKLQIQKKKWRLKNKHNNTSTTNLFNTNQVTVGKGTYGSLYVLTHGEDAVLTIGNYCSIGPDVAFVLQSDHALNHFSTYPFKVMSGLAKYEAISKGNIVIEDDVWIGLRSIILSGVHIGKGAVIGAGSIITHDIPSYAIVVGIPGKVVGYRFDDRQIEILKNIDMSKLDNHQITKIIDNLYYDINSVEDAINIKNIIG